MRNQARDFVTSLFLLAMFADREAIATVLLAQHVNIDTADLLIAKQQREIREHEATFHEVARALDDLGLTDVVRRRIITNLGLDILGIGEDFSNAPTLRTGDPRLATYQRDTFGCQDFSG